MSVPILVIQGLTLARSALVDRFNPDSSSQGLSQCGRTTLQDLFARALNDSTNASIAVISAQFAGLEVKRKRASDAHS